MDIVDKLRLHNRKYTETQKVDYKKCRSIKDYLDKFYGFSNVNPINQKEDDNEEDI